MTTLERSTATRTVNNLGRFPASLCISIIRMDILKTPHQLLLEEAGAKVPSTNGLLKSPQQMLLEETGLPQKFAPGGKVLGQLEKFLEGSKIPQRLFHGTTASEEKGAKALQQLKQSKEGALGAGVYMTPNPEFAGQYANQSGGYIMPVHANMRNPLEIHTKSGVEGNGDPMKLALMQLGVPEAKADQILEKAYDTRGYVGKEVMSRAQKQGYDGIAQYRDGDLSEVVSYNPMGVKSATGNSGEFNPYDPRLSKAAGGSIQPQMSAQDMIAEIMAQGQTPQKFAEGGSSLKHKAAQAGKLGGKALLGLGLTSSLASAAEDAGQSNAGGVALNALDIASFLSANPWLGALSGILSPSELGKGTVAEYEAETRPEDASILYGTRLPPQTKK